MRKKPLIVFFLIILTFSLSLFFYKIFKKNFLRTTPEKRHVYYAPMKIIDFTDSCIPYVHVEIEDKVYLFEFDLGFNGEANATKECLAQITNKVFVEASSMHGIRGKKYPQDIYKIPQLKIDSITFHPVQLDEENELYRKDATIIPNESSDTSISGHIGWKLFERVNLFLDLKHSCIAICDSIKTLTKEATSFNTFYKVPLLNDHGFIEIEVMTPIGPLRCLVDTGSTVNILNTPNPEDQPLDELIRDEKKFISFETFQIGDKDFGPITFHPLPLKLPFHVDAFLGIEFLLEHAVFIDFVNREIYFSKSLPDG